MHTRRIIERVRVHDWFGVVVEFAVVVLGILIAFQVTEWNGERQERAREKQYLARIAAEFDGNVSAIEHAIELTKKRGALVELMVRAIDDPAPAAAEPGRFLHAIEVGGYTFTPPIGSQTFDEIKAAGDLRVLRDELLRVDLMRFYTRVHGSGQWQQQRALGQFEYVKRSTAILTYEQAIRVRRKYPEPPDATVEEALAARTRRLQQPAFLEWLPATNQSDDEVAVLGQLLESAEELRTRLRALQ